jgi:hypothetical protein
MTAKEYVAAEYVAWTYAKPSHGGAKTLLLTIGGITIVGSWLGEAGENYLAWAPLPKRDKAKERELLDAIRAKRQAHKEMFDAA